MPKNGVLTYLHGDHLVSTFATSNSSGAFSGQEWYHAYGRFRAAMNWAPKTASPRPKVP